MKSREYERDKLGEVSIKGGPLDSAKMTAWDYLKGFYTVFSLNKERLK